LLSPLGVIEPLPVAEAVTVRTSSFWIVPMLVVVAPSGMLLFAESSVTLNVSSL